MSSHFARDVPCTVLVHEAVLAARLVGVVGVVGVAGVGGRSTRTRYGTGTSTGTRYSTGTVL